MKPVTLGKSNTFTNHYAEKFRAIQPVPYGEACLEERQPPIVSPEISEEDNSDSQATTDIDGDEDNRDISASIFEENSIIGFDRFEENVSLETISHENEELKEPQFEENEDEEAYVADFSSDVKEPLETVVLQPGEIVAFDTIFNENDSSDEENGAPQQSNVTVSPGGTKRVTEPLDSDDSECEMTYELEGATFNPQEVGIQTKLNDVLSGNFPYKENAKMKDREYLIGNGLKALISAKALRGLLQFNEPGRRENPSKDKSFVKALLISVCSLNAIQNLKPNEKPQKEMLNFIKDLFIHRIGDDAEANRYLSFNSLVQDACDEIKNNNFK